MSQILNILRKDIRHHWPEIVASIAVLIAYMVYQPRLWADRAIQIPILSVVARNLPVLMVLCWVFLIVRVIHGEPLVGDRQFWITRPYEWHKLVCAKLLFLIIFVHLPLFLTQVCLIKFASFPIFPVLKGLLWVQVYFGAAIDVPAMTVGCVTSGIGQAVIGLLLGSALMLGVVGLMSLFPDMDVSLDSPGDWTAWLLVAAAVAAIFAQYIYRRTAISRIIVSAAFAILYVVVLVEPHMMDPASGFRFPTPTQPLPLKLELDKALAFARTGDEGFEAYLDHVALEFPLKIRESDESQITQVRAARLDLDLLTGERWTSHWLSTYDAVSGERTYYWPKVELKKSDFNRLTGLKVHGRLLLGFSVYKRSGDVQIQVNDERIALPGRARCLNDVLKDSLRCFAVFKEPGPVRITANLPNESCRIKERPQESWADEPASHTNFSGDDTPDLTFSPIEDFTIDLARFSGYEDRASRLPICPGTSLIVTPLKFLYNVREEIDLGDIDVANYRPAYPRRIVPPIKRAEPEDNKGSLSQNNSGDSRVINSAFRR